MLEHDDHVGDVLDKLDELGIADNTIVFYSSDNGAETFTWPDGGTTRFKEGKGTTWEGGMRVPAVVRWPGVIEPGTIYNDIMSHEDWMPTLLAAAGEPDIVEKLKEGHTANGKEFRVHPDGYNFLPYFKGEVDKGPREEILYFGQGGELNAIRWQDWKLSFALLRGNMATAIRDIPAWPEIVNLRADPFETAPEESEMYMRWMIDNMWLFVPIAAKAEQFLRSIPDYPFQVGQNFNLANVSYRTFIEQNIVQQLDRLEGLGQQ
jgi:arylsulfatase